MPGLSVSFRARRSIRPWLFSSDTRRRRARVPCDLNSCPARRRAIVLSRGSSGSSPMGRPTTARDRADPHLGGPAAAGAGAVAAFGRAVWRAAAGHRLAKLLGGSHGRDAVDARAVGLDDQRLDAWVGARSARAAGNDHRRSARAGLAGCCREQRALSLAQLTIATQTAAPAVTAALRRLAFAGQVIHDLPHGVYRFRQVMPMALGEAQLGRKTPSSPGHDT